MTIEKLKLLQIYVSPMQSTEDWDGRILRFEKS